MVKLEAYSAVLTRPVANLHLLPNVRVTERAVATRLISAASAYAIDAVSRLDVSRDANLYTISGPPNESVEYFLPVKNKSSNGRLMGPQLAERLKSLHPYSVLVPLQNQVAASVSMQFNMTGACTNIIDSTTAFVSVMHSVALRGSTKQSLLILSSATDRSEQLALHELCYPGRAVVEGAICFVFSDNGSLGEIDFVAPGDAFDLSYGLPETPSSGATSDWPYAACLQGGIGVLWAISQGLPSANFHLSDGYGRSEFFKWRALS